MYNILTEPVINTKPLGMLSLSGVLAALTRDDVESFPALRPHQAPAWHMFLVQLAALAIHRGGLTELPRNENEWQNLLRGLTLAFADDEPWQLVVTDWSKPAFMQAPVPNDVIVNNPVPSPDALDLLITARNHDLKQAIARRSEPEDWIFALMSLQSSEGYGGPKNQGIARMNGGSSSRAMVSLAPLPSLEGKILAPAPGAWFYRDVQALLMTRETELEENGHLEFALSGGIGLVWLEDWPEGAQIQLRQLDIWFIEICRRVRLFVDGTNIYSVKGNSIATRIDGKKFNGSIGDPFTPVHKVENKSLTLSEGDFDYRRITELLLSGDWKLPLLARPAPFEADKQTFALVCAALSRGNSKTDGFKSRTLPMGGRIARSLGPRREEIHELAKAQMTEVDLFDKALSYALALAAAKGDRENIKKEHYHHAAGARAKLDRAADEIFFERLWARFAAQEMGQQAFDAEKLVFIRSLFDFARGILDAALPATPCSGVFRPRAEARARSAFYGKIWKAYPMLFQKTDLEDVYHAT